MSSCGLTIFNPNVAVVWVWPPEVSPVRFRHINSAVGPLAEWLFTFVTVKSTPPALESIGYKIYVFYTIMVFTGGIFVYLCIPETKSVLRVAENAADILMLRFIAQRTYSRRVGRIVRLW